ncbi:hypothetical protein CL619_02405 [archaeon]|nr:hypothetical protein [archaeon]|tara:strand:- start:958 stop:2160 length:1203 start_codon:yes stop_codon:yes gene_type:complete
MVLGGRKRSFAKKAQAAAAAAVLVAIIGAMLVSYVILVSPEERAAILDGDIDSDSDSTGSSGELLLEEFPGKIEYLSVDEVEHSLASVHIYTETEVQTLTERSSLFAKRSVFSSTDAEVSFGIDDVDLVDDTLLSFRVVDSSGSLSLTLNGESLLQQEFTGEESVTIDLPTELLQEDNELVFSASSPGAAFWSSNEISIESLIIVSDVTDNSHREATGVFSISDTEYENMETAVFSFQPDCASDTSGTMIITLNSAYTLYSASPDCSVQMGDVELDPSMLFVGQNTLHFSTDTGDYVLYNLEVKSDLIDVEYPTYYFQLTYEEEQSVLNDDDTVEVTLEFADEGETKAGYVSINGYKRHFDTTSSSYSFDISDYVTSGNNAISIQPSKTLEVRELLVDLE